MKSVMRIVEKMAREKDVWVEELSNESEERDNYATVYQRMSDANAFGNSRNKRERDKRLQQQVV